MSKKKTKAKSQRWRRSTAYRKWRIKVIRRDKVCTLCGSNKRREAHHLNNGSHHPEERFDENNGVTLCRSCHSQYHNKYMGSWRKKTNKKDYKRFLKLVEYLNEIQNEKPN